MVTKVSFTLEVSAENKKELNNKLYGYCDYEAKCRLVGFDVENEPTHEEIREEMAWQNYTMQDVHDLQEKQETVNELLRNTQFEGHGVLFKTDGTNLSGDGPRKIPHFNHSATCENHNNCKNDSETNYYRMFSPADLVLEGNADTDILGDYKLREDVVVSLTGIQTNPQPGKEKAKKL